MRVTAEQTSMAAIGTFVLDGSTSMPKIHEKTVATVTHGIRYLDVKSPGLTVEAP
jgi:hypothetical protein